MNSLISIKGRNLVYGVLVVNEVLNLAKKSHKDCLIFKMNFEKVYDSVNWRFLEYMLAHFGFEDRWRAWIRACAFSRNDSILVNRSLTEEISI